ncbi:MAG: hypothetical protein J6T82_08365 [Bacteroidaceae bacterium]|nr:hypothetical protein [Bacteroidaceae bacterium]
MIGFIRNKRDNMWKQCSPETFGLLLDDQRVAQTIADVRNGNAERKGDLPAFIFGGWLNEKLYNKYVEECKQRGEKPRGSRCEEFLQPTGLFMMDFDRTEGNANELYAKFLSAMRTNGVETKGFLAFAHRTAKGHGLRLVLKGRSGSTIEADQKWISELMGEAIDEVCKDFSRLSFCPCRDDTYFIDPDLLFGEPFSGIYQKCKDENMQKCKDQNTEKCKDAKMQEGKVVQPDSQFKERFTCLNKALVVKALEEQLGGAPKHGSRNNFIFAMACHLTHLYGKDPATIGALVPTYGERIDRWRSSIESACRTAKLDAIPDVLKRAVEVAETRQKLEDETPAEGIVNEEPQMPKKLPPLIALLTSKVPLLYKPAVAMSVFPALGAHLGGVTFRYIDNVPREATFMSVLMAKMSSGKSCINQPIKYVLADIEERDADNRHREQEWKMKLSTKGANKEKPQRPDDLCIQVLVPDMTNAAFVQRLQDAGGKFLYTLMDEIELLDQLKTSARGQQVSQIIRLAFDCGEYGQERVGAQSVTAKVRVKWNWNASTTIQKGKDYFHKALTDGTLSRLSFSTIRAERGADLPRIGTYDDDFAAELRPFIDYLNKAKGEVVSMEATKLAEHLMKECQRLASLSYDETYEVLSYRALVIAYLRAMTLYVAHGCQWSDEIAQFTRWSLKYDLWCKLTFFGKALDADIVKEEEVNRRPGPRSLLEVLPDTFTVTDLKNLRFAQGMKPTPKDCLHMLDNWLHRKYICRGDNDGEFKKLKMEN